MTTSFQNTTQTNSQITSGTTAQLKAEPSSFPLQTQIYVDARFGTLMFPAAGAAINSMSPTSGSCGTIISIGGQGLTGAATVMFGGTLAPAFTLINDDRLEVVAPSGVSAGSTMSVSVSGEGFGPITAGQFQYTGCNQ